MALFSVNPSKIWNLPLCGCVRVLRQKEYDNMALFTDQQMEMAEQSERSKCNVLEYIEKLIKEREETASESIVVNWRRLHTLLSMFAKCDYIQFSQIDMKYIEAFRSFLIKAPQGGSKKGTISRNTASTYFSIFKAALKQAFVDGYLNCDIAAKAKISCFRVLEESICHWKNLIYWQKTPCDDILKRAALFSALTGMRHSDIQKLNGQRLKNTMVGTVSISLSRRLRALNTCLYRHRHTSFAVSARKTENCWCLPDCLTLHGYLGLWNGG